MNEMQVKFPDYCDDLAAFEVESKGFLDDVIVTLADGRSYRLSFRDSWNVDLAHDASGSTARGCRYLALPNVLILDKVSRQNILDTIRLLAETSFFDLLGPVARPDESARRP